MSEQELYMIGDDRGKDENAAQSLLNKHINLEKAVEDFQEDIDDLRRRSEELVAAEHPERYGKFSLLLSLIKLFLLLLFCTLYSLGM